MEVQPAMAWLMGRAIIFAFNTPFSFLLTLQQQDLLLSHCGQLLSHGRPLGLLRDPLELHLVLLNLDFEPLKLVHSTTVNRSNDLPVSQQANECE